MFKYGYQNQFDKFTVQYNMALFPPNEIHSALLNMVVHGCTVHCHLETEANQKSTMHCDLLKTSPQCTVIKIYFINLIKNIEPLYYLAGTAGTLVHAILCNKQTNFCYLAIGEQLKVELFWISPHDMWSLHAQQQI